MAKGCILLIDDDKDIVCSFKTILEDEGYKVYSASDAEKAMDLVKRKDITVVILDYVLPKVKGDQLAKEIVALNKGIKIIFVSGYSDVTEVVQRLDFVCDVMLKPINPDSLISLIKTLDYEQMQTAPLLYPYYTGL